MNLDDRNIYVIDPQLFNLFPNLHDLSIKGHEISEPYQRDYIKKILELTPKLKYLWVDY